MDHITGAILAAVAGGAASGAAEGLAAEGYRSLTAAIRRKLGKDSDLAEAVEKLEQKPESEGRRTTLAEEVADAKLAQDEEMVKQAQELIAALMESAAGQQALSKYNIQVQDSQVAVIGDHAQVQGGIHFSSRDE
jgi:hypothetical protein